MLFRSAQYDRKLIVEAAVEHAREVEVSVLGNDEPVASVVGEILPSHEFYDYESKYLDVCLPFPTVLQLKSKELCRGTL